MEKVFEIITQDIPSYPNSEFGNLTYFELIQVIKKGLGENCDEQEIWEVCKTIDKFKNAIHFAEKNYSFVEEFLFLALPYIESYTFDLIVDLNYFKEHLLGGKKVFYFGVRKSGTHLTTREDLKETVKRSNKKIWKITVFSENDWVFEEGGF